MYLNVVYAINWIFIFGFLLSETRKKQQKRRRWRQRKFVILQQNVYQVIYWKMWLRDTNDLAWTCSNNIIFWNWYLEGSKGLCLITHAKIMIKASMENWGRNWGWKLTSGAKVSEMSVTIFDFSKDLLLCFVFISNCKFVISNFVRVVTLELNVF